MVKLSRFYLYLKRRYIFFLILFFIVPVCFLIVSFVFQKRVRLDEVKVVEELAKGLITWFFIFLSLYHNEYKDSHKIENQAKAIIGNIQTIYKNNSGLFDRLNKAEIDFSEHIEIEKVKSNHIKKQKFNDELLSLKNILLTARDHILNSSPESAAKCREYLSNIESSLESIESYNSNQCYSCFNNIHKNINSISQLQQVG